MHTDHITRYTLQLDALEPDPAVSDEQAIAVLHGEFALAQNASYFDQLTAEEIDVHVVSRTVPQDGVARYALTLDLPERTPAMSDEQAAELVQREFARALNASHFIHTCPDESRVSLVSRVRSDADVAVRSA